MQRLLFILFKVVVPEEYLGTVLGDLSLRRAAIVKVLPREGMKLIIADVPLACLMVRLCYGRSHPQ